MNTPQDIWAIGQLSSVERVTVDADGIHVTLNSPVGFNAVSSLVTLSNPKRALNEYLSLGQVDGAPVRVSLPVGERVAS